MKMFAFNEMLTELDNSSSDGNIALLVRYVSRNGLKLNETASLARKLAETGSSLPAGESVTADVPSTGGPSSLSTLICPLFLRLKGFTVPKLGVPGRPAGGIDVLATIPRYKTNLSREEVIRCLDECQYSHFLAGEDFVPLDARMFRIRQELGFQANPHLVAASLISKKLAASVTHFRLDVRVGPHGNFGRTLKEARVNARMFNSIARSVGLDSGCYLGDGTAVYQPYIGRGEALAALDDLFNDRPSPWLKEHVENCWDMTESLKAVNEVPSGSMLKEVFAENLVAQGSNVGEFQRRVDEVRESSKTTIRANSSGYLQIDLNVLRRLLVQSQASHSSELTPFSDPCGVELLCRPGQKVDAEQPLAHVRGFNDLRRVANATEETIDSAFCVVPYRGLCDVSDPRFDPEWVMRGVE